MRIFLKILYKSVMTAVLFTTLFLIMNTIDKYLVSKGIVENKIYVLAPIQFFLVIMIYMTMLYIVYWFKLM
jgi:hypothetical protein